MGRRARGCMRNARRRVAVVVGLGLVIATALAAWLVWPRERINLLVITLDTTRADRIGCFGYEPALTPNLDRLAQQGVLFQRAYTAVPLTLPSHATMFTGLAPREHGLHHNGAGKLNSRIPTLAEMLRAKGYRTGAFVGAFVLNRKFGLDRGFLEYDDFTGAEFVDHRVERRRSGQIVVDAALAWLEGAKARPFFCWVHLFDPHAPYLDREEMFGPRFAGRPYDAGIAFADQQVGRIVSYLEQHGLKDRTLIVVVGDHGEGLGEHKEREHGLMLYNSTLRVPLITSYPSLCKPGHEVSQAVSLVDLFPTIGDCLGLKGAEKLHARSLRQALRGEPLAPRPCYAETEIPFLEHRCAPQRCLVAECWKYVKSPRPELYDLAADPDEIQNLAESRPEKQRELQLLLAEAEALLPARPADEVALSAAEKRALVSLGYAADAKGDGDDPSGHSLPDIKDRIEQHDRLEEANRLLDEDRPEEALARLREITAAIPEDFAARMFLGEALARSGELDEALGVFLDLAAREADRGEVHSRIGWILGRQGRVAEALGELQRAAELAPETAEYHVNLGASFLEIGHAEEARRSFQSAIELDPAVGHFEIGKLLAASGDGEAAIHHYRLTLKHDPNWTPLHAELSLLLARQNKLDEAVEQALLALEANPRDADLHYNLGVMLAQQGHFENAVSQLKQALQLNPEHPKAGAQLERVAAGLPPVLGKRP